jgi:hypothetical protein
MINHIFFEGIVVSIWKFGSDLFARLASYRDPGQPLKRISETRDEPDYINIRFTNAASQGVPFQKGSLIRVEGLLQSREYQENLSEFLVKAQKSATPLPEIPLDPQELRQVRCGRSTSEILVEKFVLQAGKSPRQRIVLPSETEEAQVPSSSISSEPVS